MALQHKKQQKNLTHNECDKRYRKRKKLKEFAAELLKSAQTQPYEKRDRHDIRTLDAQIRMSIKLPYRWTEEDMQKAWEQLRIIRRQLKLDEKSEQVIHLENLLHLILDDSKATVPERLTALCDTLAHTGKELLTAKEAEVTEALVLTYLAQQDKTATPAWLIPALIAMLRHRFTTKEMLTLAKGLGLDALELEKKLAALRPTSAGSTITEATPIHKDTLNTLPDNALEL